MLAAMSTLKERLRADLTTAMKSRDELRSATLRMALTAVTNEEVSGKEARELGDDEVVRVLMREAKKRRESAEAYSGASRPELAQREQAELGVLEAYLPAALSEEELREIVTSAVAEAGVTDLKGMGAVMKLATPKVAGRADGGRVSAEVRRQLAS